MDNHINANVIIASKTNINRRNTLIQVGGVITLGALHPSPSD